MGALNYIAYVAFAVIFLSIGLAIYSGYQRGSAEQEFRLRAEGLAGTVGDMGDQSAGTVMYFSISVPSNCELSFSDSMVIISIGAWSDNFQTGVPVSGPSFTDRVLELRLERTEGGVSVSEQA